MKKFLFVSIIALICGITSGVAKDIKTVVFKTSPEMHCDKCENKIKSNLRFEKGIKEIVTDLNTKTVKVTYDEDKTNVENIIKGFAKIKYQATVFNGCNKKCSKDHKEGCCGKGEGCGKCANHDGQKACTGCKSKAGKCSDCKNKNK
jgi:copper chaperone CopZ